MGLWKRASNWNEETPSISFTPIYWLILNINGGGGSGSHEVHLQFTSMFTKHRQKSKTFCEKLPLDDRKLFPSTASALCTHTHAQQSEQLEMSPRSSLVSLRISFNPVLFSLVRSCFLRLLLHCVWVNVWLYWYKWLQTTRINHISVMTAFLLCFLCVQYNDNNKFIRHGPQFGRDRHALHRQTHTYLFIRWKRWTVWKELENVRTSCHLILLNWSLIELLAASDGSRRRFVGRLLWQW